jgi:triosephosphate isomerase
MFGRRADIAVIGAVADGMGPNPGLDVAICPPATLLAAAGGQGLALGGQDCAPQADGAHTGDVSAAMLADAGAAYVILGHSERRRDHGETDALIAAKANAAMEAGLSTILCVGETLEERKAGRAEAVVGAQLAASLPARCDGQVVVAYEPVWAIGTGLTPGLDDIQAMHAFIRATLVTRFAMGGAMRVLYGGSVKPDNAAAIFRVPEVDGGLIGGASLKSADFLAIVRAHPHYSGR